MEPIQFGRKKALNVKDPDKRMVILNSFRRNLMVRQWENNNKLEKFSDISEDICKNLQEDPYVIRSCPEYKMNKECTEYFLYLFTLGEHLKKGSKMIACFIEKKIPLDKARIIQTRLRFRQDLYKGTIISGTLAPANIEETKDRIVEAFGLDEEG